MERRSAAMEQKEKKGNREGEVRGTSSVLRR